MSSKGRTKPHPLARMRRQVRAVTKKLVALKMREVFGPKPWRHKTRRASGVVVRRSPVCPEGRKGWKGGARGA
jgi:hypothetical protein